MGGEEEEGERGKYEQWQLGGRGRVRVREVWTVAFRWVGKRKRKRESEESMGSGN